MCGIAGRIAGRTGRPQVERMLGVSEHRGPDDCGTYSCDTVQLGFRRLAIVDLSPAGHQPMCNEDGTVWLVFNGEIYNYQPLVSELKARGHAFRSRTDTETIIHAYEEWGVECVHRFNGMFAFALWDGRRQRLFCARDRFGVKPFYYVHGEHTGDFVFASEIKALLQDPAVPRRANRLMILDFLSIGLLDHTDQTCFEGVMQLPAAHYMVLERGKTTMHRYWDVLPDTCETKAQPCASERRRWAADLHDLLEDSVRLRLQADVPVGTCLSGGLDSSTIVCLANRLLFNDDAGLQWHERGQRQKTFSACYDDERHDERTFIQAVLDATGAEANFTFPGKHASLEELIPQVIWHQDEPFGSTSILAQWHVMEAAHRRGVTVLLDGQGADELLAGYHDYFGAALADDLLSFRPGQLARDLQFYRRYHAPGWRDAGSLLVNALLPPSTAALQGLRNFYRSRRLGARVLNRETAAGYRPSDTWHDCRAGKLKTLLYNHIASTSLPPLLHYEDRNSMAFSIEARTPFLDYRIAEFMAPLPNAAFIEHGLTKVLLRDAMRGVLPEKVRTRLDKKGFSTPEDTWFRTSLRGWVRSVIESRSLACRGFVDAAQVLDVFNRHLAGEINASTLIWRVVNVELWARMFLDPAGPPRKPLN